MHFVMWYCTKLLYFHWSLDPIWLGSGVNISKAWYTWCAVVHFSSTLFVATYMLRLPHPVPTILCQQYISDRGILCINTRSSDQTYTKCTKFSNFDEIKLSSSPPSHFACDGETSPPLPSHVQPCYCASHATNHSMKTNGIEHCILFYFQGSTKPAHCKHDIRSFASNPMAKKTTISVSEPSENMTLNKIITSYFRKQHALCKNPVVTCPPFSLYEYVYWMTTCCNQYYCDTAFKYYALDLSDSASILM